MKALYRPFRARDPFERHRAATPLELFFDLVSVVAIAAAAAGLHHSIAEAHAVQGIASFAMAFFAIWWAWMNYTWYASAYDNDDSVFRLLTMVIMAGSLTMAAGIGSFLDGFDLKLMVAGYMVMRVGMIALWLRAARNDPDRRKTALNYAIGIGLVQVYWVFFFLLQPLSAAMVYTLFGIGAVLELTVPAVAERHGTTPWHRHHIIERYGLLNIIVLGETVLAGVLALREVGNGVMDTAFIHTALSALVILFSMWWLYFSEEEHLDTNDLNRALIWGYGHFIVFAAGAAVGAGFAVLVDVIAGHAKISPAAGKMAVGIPVALYMLGLWFVRDRYRLRGAAKHVLPLFAVVVLLAPLVPWTLDYVAAAIVLSVVVRTWLARRYRERRTSADPA